MATIERVREAGKLDTHTRVATAVPTRQVYYAPPPFFHHQSTKVGEGFTPHGSPNLGKSPV